MFNFIKSVVSSPTTATVVSTGYNAIRSVPSSQPKLAPVAFGGSVVAGVVTMLISGYKVTDCLRFQTSSGQCDSVIERNLPGMVTGVATIVGGWGAFNTFNPKLHESPEEAPAIIPPRGLVVEPPAPTPPHPEVIRNLHAEGNSQAKVADMLGISVYAVRKALGADKQ